MKKKASPAHPPKTPAQESRLRAAGAPVKAAFPIVGIGASAGGPGALAAVLGKLPASFGGSIVIVQHVDKAFAEGMAQWLDSQTELAVRVAVSGDRPRPGEVLLAATNDHLHIARTGSLEYTVEPAATLGSIRDALVWKQENIERWIAQGEDAAKNISICPIYCSATRGLEAPTIFAAIEIALPSVFRYISI